MNLETKNRAAYNSSPDAGSPNPFEYIAHARFLIHAVMRRMGTKDFRECLEEAEQELHRPPKMRPVKARPYCIEVPEAANGD